MAKGINVGALEKTATDLGIDVSKYQGNPEALRDAVIQVKNGGKNENPLPPPAPPADQPPPQQPAPPPQAPQPMGPPGPHPQNNPWGRAMNQAHAVVHGNPFMASPHVANLMENERSMKQAERYIEKENDSRVEQAKAEAERQHDIQMELLRQQGKESLLERVGQARQQQPPEAGGLRMWDPQKRQWVYGSKVQSKPYGGMTIS